MYDEGLISTKYFLYKALNTQTLPMTHVRFSAAKANLKLQMAQTDGRRIYVNGVTLKMYSPFNNYNSIMQNMAITLRGN